MQHIELSAKQFIEACKGVTVLDEQRVWQDFYEKKTIIGLDTYDSSVHLQNIIVKEPVKIGEEDIPIFTKNIIINNCTFEQDFEINAGVFEKIFRIVRANFKGRFRVFGGEFKDEFWISDGSYQDSFRIYGGIFEKITFTKGSFENGIEISTADSKDPSSIETLKFKMSAFIKQDVFVRAGTKVDHIDFEEGIAASGRVFIDGITVDTIRFTKFVNEGVLEITSLNGKKMHWYKESFPLNERILKITSTNKKKVHWYKELLPYLLWRYLTASIEHSLNYLSKMWKWSKTLFRKKKLKVSFAKSNTFSIINSNMGKTVMRDIDAREFTVEVRDSKLNDITNIGARFPKERQICSKIVKHKNQPDELQYDPKQMAETYSQLYLAIQKQGYRLQELDYYCAYLEWQRKSVKNRIKTDILSYFPAYVSLTLHKWSTAFGRNWLRGIFFSLFMGCLLYLGFVYNLHNICKTIEDYTKEGSWLGFHLKHFLHFLIPTHKPNYVNNIQPGGIASVFDFLGRIILTYLYYQIATASRRFGRK